MPGGAYIPEFQLWADTPILTNLFTGEHPFTRVGDYGLQPLQNIAVGPKTFVDPVPPSKATGGGYVRVYLSDYYNRVHVTPVLLDFGTVASETDLNVFVWNAYLTDITLTGIIAVNDEGVSISDGPLPGAVCAGLEDALYRVTVSPEGPPSIETTYTFTFNSGDEPLVLAVGTRAVVWDFFPNWSSPYRITYQYRTDIIRSRSGREQRRALRQQPRKTIEFSISLLRSEVRRFSRRMFQWQNRIFAVPELTRKVISTSGMPSGGRVMELESIPSWIIPGAIVLLSYRGTLLPREVESIEANVVTFTTRGTFAWPIGTVLHPSLSALVSASMSGQRPTSKVANVSVRIEVEPGSETLTPVPDAPLTFDGRELLLIKPNWAAPISLSYDFDREELDYQSGRKAIFRPIDFGSRLYRAVFLGRDPEESRLLLHIFHRMKGQQGEFYMPTFEDDAELRTPILANDQTVRLIGTEIFETLLGDTLHTVMAFFHVDGRITLNRVVNMTFTDDAIGKDTIIEFRDLFTEVINPDDLRQICWVYAWRYGSDGLTFDWLTDKVSQTQMSLRALEDIQEGAP